MADHAHPAVFCAASQRSQGGMMTQTLYAWGDAQSTPTPGHAVSVTFLLPCRYGTRRGKRSLWCSSSHPLLPRRSIVPC